MRFTILMSYSEAGGAALSPAEMEAGRLEFDAYGSALHEAGVLVAAEVFTPVASGLTVHGGTVAASTDASEQQLSGVFVIDVAGGDKVPRKGGPGVTFSDLLVINKTDLAPMVGADLDVMRRDAAKVRDDRPFVLISLTDDPTAGPVLQWVREQLRVSV